MSQLTASQSGAKHVPATIGVGMAATVSVPVVYGWDEYTLMVSRHPWVHIDETADQPRVVIAFNALNDRIFQVESTKNGTESFGEWKGKWIEDNGRRPFVRKDKTTGWTHYLYWRNDAGGTIYGKRSTDGGSTFKESEIAVAVGVPEQAAVLDWRIDAAHTIDLVYTDGTDVLRKVSTDNGLTWGAADTLVSGATNPFLRYDRASGLMFLTYWETAGSRVMCRRSADHGSTWIGSPSVILTGMSTAFTLTLDFELNGGRRILAVYTDNAGDIATKFSTDTGNTWS